MTDLATNVLRRCIPDASVHPAYLDLPFNSNRDYKVTFRNESGNATQRNGR